MAFDGFMGKQMHLIHCRIAFKSSLIAIIITEVEKQEERLNNRNICINWAVV